MSRSEEHPVRTCDELLLRNRALIEQAKIAIEDVNRLAHTCTDLSERMRARSLLLRQQSKDISARFIKIQAGTEDRCRRSQQAFEESGASVPNPGTP
ncbi:hypothetical protein [Azospirillum sp. sgz301742]